MTKILSLTFLLCLIFTSAFSQTQHLILTAEQNSKWLDSLKTLPLDQQLLTINDRLLSDTNVFVRQSYPDRIKVTDSLGNRVYGDSKPTLIIGGYPMIIDNKTKTSKIVSLTKMLTIKFIKTINILSPNDPAASALYGSASLSGIIVMTLTKKKYLKKFRRLNLKPNY
jgi:hypothetical protein